MKTTISEYDYLIMNTGYTFRLLDRLGLQVIETEKENTNKNDYKKNGIFKIEIGLDQEHEKQVEIQSEYHDSDDIDFIYDGDIKSFNKEIIFIRDGSWGNGLYKMKDKDEDFDKVIKILEKNFKKKELNGVICFKKNGSKHNFCRINEYTQMLRDANYCCLFDMESICLLEEDDIKICIVNFDSESG